MEINDVLNNKYSLIFIIIIAFIYNIIVHRSNIAVISMIFIFLYFYYLYDVQNKINNSEFKSKSELIADHSEKMVEDKIKLHKDDNYYIDNMNIYPIYKKPKKFIFLKHDKYLEKVLYDLRFVEKYDKDDYFKLMILIENFLKIYYNLIIDRYDEDYVDILLDVRKEILNITYNFKVDAPLYSKKNKHLEPIIHDNIIKLQSYTYQKIKNINKKYPHIQVKNPLPITKHDLYDTYNIVV